MATDPDEMLGLYDKYDVRIRADHPMVDDYDLPLCDMFVLDCTHDPFSALTLKEYHQSWDRDPDRDQLNGTDYVVTRRNDLTGKHKGCAFFVLNLTVDKHARWAIPTYIELCREKYPGLAADLTESLRRNRLGEDQEVGRREPEIPQEERPAPGSGQ